MAALGDRVPNEDVSIEAVHGPAVGRYRFRHPVIVIGRAHLMRVTILQRPAYAVNENGWILLQHLCFSLLARQIGEHVQDIFRMQECQLLRQAWISLRFQLGEQSLSVRSSKYWNPKPYPGIRHTIPPKHYQTH